METILTAKDLCKTFSQGKLQQHVLKNLNLEINKGDFVNRILTILNLF